MTDMRRALAITLLRRRVRMLTRIQWRRRDAMGQLLANVVTMVKLAAFIAGFRWRPANELERRAVQAARAELRKRYERKEIDR